jgi:hypothetical protein
MYFFVQTTGIVFQIFKASGKPEIRAYDVNILTVQVGKLSDESDFLNLNAYWTDL